MSFDDYLIMENQKKKTAEAPKSTHTGQYIPWSHEVLYKIKTAPRTNISYLLDCYLKEHPDKDYRRFYNTVINK